MRWYRAASGQGQPGAQLVLARLDGTAQGRGKNGKRRMRRANTEERRLADNRWTRYAGNGDAIDRYHLGLMYESGIAVEADHRQARLWYQKAAERRHLDAQVALARLCESTDADTDLESAVHWWREAAQQGSAEAQYTLGQRYASGAGTEPDPLKSMSWTMRAAEQGHAEALIAVAAALTGSAGALADACHARAAEQGHAQAQFVMGQRFATGDGVAQCLEQAREWFERAANQVALPCAA